MADFQARLRRAEIERDRYACDIARQERENQHLRKLLGRYKAQRHNDRRKLERAQKGLATLRKRMEVLGQAQKAANTAAKERRDAEMREDHVRGDAEFVLARIGTVNRELRGDLRLCHRRIRTLEKLCARFPKRLADRVERAKIRPVTFRLKKKGIYTSQARALAGMLIRSGCSQSKVGGLVQKVGAAFGISIPERMSGRTVQRSVLERKIAYDIQLGYELKRSPS